MEYVTRYIVTHLRNGFRCFFDPRQGRYTYATPEEAQQRIDAFLAEPSNTPDRWRSINVNENTLEVCTVSCYPGHFDPAGQEPQLQPQQENNMSESTFTAAMREQFSLPGETAMDFMKQLKALDANDKAYFHRELQKSNIPCTPPQGVTA